MIDARGKMGPPAVKLVLAFAAVYVIWGSTYLAIKYAIETLPPMLMAGTRFIIAGGALLLAVLHGWALAGEAITMRTMLAAAVII